MGRDGHSPEGRGQDRGAGQDPRGPGLAPAGSARTAADRRAPPAVPPLHAALSAALQQRVAQRAARAPGVHPSLVGHLCERCLDAPAFLVQPAPWGGEMGVCTACHHEPPAGDAAPHAG
jgi:hypothetical protein